MLAHGSVGSATNPCLTAMDGLGVQHQTRHHPQQPPQHHHNQAYGSSSSAAQSLVPSEPPRKRKADGVPESNERLSKRLSLLNLGV
jgi:hypothetical protein